MIIKFCSLLSPKSNKFFSALRTQVLSCKLCSTARLEEPLCDKEYLLILDFEATCDHKKKYVQEIIEFPCLKFNIRTLKEEGRFHHYVKPVINPVLSYFCIELTGILQEMVDDEKTFPEVYQLFEEWRKKEGLTEENSMYVTSGDWDLGHMLPKQCSYCNLPIPSHMKEWIDIKKLYGFHSRHYCDSLIQVIKSLGLEFEGKQHSGIVDCLNILNVVKKMALSGAQFKPTSRLTVVESGHKLKTVGFERVYKFSC